MDGDFLHMQLSVCVCVCGKVGIDRSLKQRGSDPALLNTMEYDQEGKCVSVCVDLKQSSFKEIKGK